MGKGRRDAGYRVLAGRKIRKHRDKYNKVGGDHYSYRDWEMYARKVPLLQVLKYMPQSIELSNAIAASNAAEAGHGVTIDGFGVIVEGNEGDEPPPGNAGQDQKQTYSQADFDKNLPEWQKLIAEGKKTPDQIITTLTRKAPLTEAQISTIKNSPTDSPTAKPGTNSAQGQPGNAGAAAPEAVSFAQVESKLLKADAQDVLDLAADLIGEVADPKQREELSALYHKRQGELAQGKPA